MLKTFVEGKCCFLKALPCVLFTKFKAHWASFFRNFQVGVRWAPFLEQKHFNKCMNCNENLRIHNLHIPCAFPLYKYHLLPNWRDDVFHIELMARKKVLGKKMVWSATSDSEVERDRGLRTFPPHKVNDVKILRRDFSTFEMILEKLENWFLQITKAIPTHCKYGWNCP